MESAATQNLYYAVEFTLPNIGTKFTVDVTLTDGIPSQSAAIERAKEYIKKWVDTCDADAKQIKF